MLSPAEAAVLVAGGLVAGFINTLAGGGSFLTVGLLIFVGLPPTVANATNRVGVLIQNLAAMRGFEREGVPGRDVAVRLLPATLIGSGVGAWWASGLSDEAFQTGFAVLMLAAMPILLRKPEPREDRRAQPLWLQLGIYFAVGLYGGAVQAGIGIPLVFALVGAGGLGLVGANSVKVVLIGALTAVALAWFAIQGQVVWTYGLVLALGSGVGGYAASRLGVRVGDRLIRPVLALAMISMAIRLLWPN